MEPIPGYDDWKLENPEDEAEKKARKRRRREARDRRDEERFDEKREG